MAKKLASKGVNRLKTNSLTSFDLHVPPFNTLCWLGGAELGSTWELVIHCSTCDWFIKLLLSYRGAGIQTSWHRLHVLRTLVGLRRQGWVLTSKFSHFLRISVQVLATRFVIYQSFNVYLLDNQFSMSNSKNIMFHWNIKGIMGVYHVACTHFGLAQWNRY